MNWYRRLAVVFAVGGPVAGLGLVENIPPRLDDGAKVLNPEVVATQNCQSSQDSTTIHRVSDAEFVVNMTDHHVDFLEVTSRIIKGGHGQVSSKKSVAYVFVDAAEGEVLPAGYLDRQSTSNVTFRPQHALALGDGDYCEDISMTILESYSDSVPGTLKHIDCFEMLKGVRRDLSRAEYFRRVSPPTMGRDRSGRPEVRRAGGGAPKGSGVRSSTAGKTAGATMWVHRAGEKG